MIPSWRTIAVVLTLYLVIFRPVSAAGLVHKGMHMASHAGDSIGTFASHL